MRPLRASAQARVRGQPVGIATAQHRRRRVRRRQRSLDVAAGGERADEVHPNLGRSIVEPRRLSRVEGIAQAPQALVEPAEFLARQAEGPQHDDPVRRIFRGGQHPPRHGPGPLRVHHGDANQLARLRGHAPSRALTGAPSS